MKNILTLIAVAMLTFGCASTAPSKAEAPQKAPAEVDFGDYTSQTLTTNAWLALAEGKYDHVLEYTGKCLELYEKKAIEMQASLDAKAHIDKVHDYWALNDVGTSYFIRGEALVKLGRKDEALAAYTKLKDELFYAQAWDPKGWFWSPADASYSKIDVLSGDF